MSNAWTEGRTAGLWRYLVTRFPPHLFAPCAALLVIAGMAGGRSLDLIEAGLSLLLAMTMLLQFRLLDDLADRRRDRIDHPNRVMVRASTLRPFLGLLLVCATGSAALIARRPGSMTGLVVFLALNVSLLLWYGLFRRWVTARMLAYHVVAAKYPIFVYILGADGRTGWNLLLAMALIYFCFCTYEVLHDRQLQAEPWAERTLHLELGLLLTVAVLMTVVLFEHGSVFAVPQALLSVGGALVLGHVFIRRRLHRASAGAAYLVFAVTFILSGVFSLGVRL